MNELALAAPQGQIVPRIGIGEMKEMATAIVESGLFGGIQNESQAMTLMLLSQAKGMHPVLILEDYDIVAGRPAMKAQRMLAKFQQAGGVIRWQQRDDEVCRAEFSHPSCPDPVEVEWTIKMAVKAGLANKNIWRQYPRAMLSSRVISEGVRYTFPAAVGGDVYTPEEIADFGTEPTDIPDADAEVKVRRKGRSKSAEANAEPTPVHNDTTTRSVAVTEKITLDQIKNSPSESRPAKDPEPEPKAAEVEVVEGKVEERVVGKPAPDYDEDKDQIPGLEERPSAKEEILPSQSGDLPPELAFLAEHEEKAIAWLQGVDWLKQGQSLSQLDRAHVIKISERSASFLATIGAKS